MDKKNKALVQLSLFCNQVEELRNSNYLVKFSSKYYNIKSFDNDCNHIERVINDLYNDNNEDIDSFTDMINLVHLITIEVIKNPIFDIKQVDRMANMRILAKKQAKRKYRDFKYRNRKFWNNKEAHNSYYELVNYVWKPSVREIIKIFKQYRAHNL